MKYILESEKSLKHLIYLCLNFFILLGLFNVYALRINLSVAIVAMTEFKDFTWPNGTITKEQIFPWDSVQKGYVLSSFYYGYLSTQVIGGVIAAKIGGNLVNIYIFLSNFLSFIFFSCLCVSCLALVLVLQLF